ncbi:hypothetical protein GH741_17135 [Aquibacillus halophilus]|uniref:Uncharacterized protein n=1 Tax=Aquibacillus halophilus TaxID=930132 RepID=A0A6A8DGL7_9BACI|nr:hypothetical protein [Aquibacillus halophilus]MRH44370.1 hypothetical protein [Aquibacillus halophilus]
MGLFINAKGNPGVFKNQEKIPEPNQAYLKIDRISEIVNEQKKTNNSILNSIQGLNSLYHKQQDTQAVQWKNFNKQLSELGRSKLTFEEFETFARERLKILYENDEKLLNHLEDESALKRDLINQISLVNDSNQEMVNQLGEFESTNQQITVRMQELFELNKQMSDQLSNHGDNQSTMLDHLENQEALMEKTLRQLTHFRSALYERTNYLVEKIENSYSLTSSFVYKLFTGSNLPLTFSMSTQKNDKDYKNSD